LQLSLLMCAPTPTRSGQRTRAPGR
jgi:hypothetical protein